MRFHPKSITLIVVACLSLAVTGSSQKKATLKNAAPAVQKNDEAYTKKILEYTTEKYFLTELVDLGVQREGDVAR